MTNEYRRVPLNRDTSERFQRIVCCVYGDCIDLAAIDAGIRPMYMEMLLTCSNENTEDHILIHGDFHRRCGVPEEWLYNGDGELPPLWSPRVWHMRAGAAFDTTVVVGAVKHCAVIPASELPVREEGEHWWSWFRRVFDLVESRCTEPTHHHNSSKSE